MQTQNSNATTTSILDALDRKRAERDEIILWHELQGIVKLGRTTVWRLEKDGSFPKRIKLSPGRIGWKVSSVLEWIASREAA